MPRSDLYRPADQPGLTRGHEPAQPHLMCCTVLFTHDQLADRAADGLVLGVAEQFLRRTIPIGHHPESIHAHETVSGRIDQPLRAAVSLQQLHFRTFGHL